MFPTAHGIVSQGGQGGDEPPAETFTGIASYGSMASGIGSGQEMGWWFTVGDDPLTVVALRLYSYTAQVTRPVRVWRTSDQALLAQVNVTNGPHGSLGGWSDPHAITPIVLSAGASYLVSTSAPNGETFAQPTAANITVSAHITPQGSAWGGPIGQFPPQLSGTRFYGLGDIVYHL